VVHVQFLDGGVHNVNQPSCDRVRGSDLDARHERIGVPAYPGVSLTDLYHWTTQSADTDDGMQGSSTIPDEEHHAASWDALVLVRPRVAEIAPDVDQPQTSERASRLLRRYEFEVRIDDTREDTRAVVVTLPTCLAQILRQFAAISQERKDRCEAAI